MGWEAAGPLRGHVPWLARAAIAGLGVWADHDHPICLSGAVCFPGRRLRSPNALMAVPGIEFALSEALQAILPEA